VADLTSEGGVGSGNGVLAFSALERKRREGEGELRERESESASPRLPCVNPRQCGGRAGVGSPWGMHSSGLSAS
jgi:hypothetical protein